MAKATTIIIPKWIGSYPSSVTIGKNIGVSIKIAANVSINIPTINKSNIIINIIIIGFSLIEIKADDTVCGKWINFKIFPITVATYTINNIGTVVLTDSTVTWIKLSLFSVR